MVLQSVSGHGVAAQEHLAANFASRFVVVAVVVRVKVNLSEQKSPSYFYMTISEVRFTQYFYGIFCLVKDHGELDLITKSFGVILILYANVLT